MEDMIKIGYKISIVDWLEDKFKFLNLGSPDVSFEVNLKDLN